MNEPATAKAMISHLPPKAAMMAAVEILLADPAALGDDVLESALYILREKLRGMDDRRELDSGTQGSAGASC